jgi:uncharacterized protein YcbK (DUF882 family)
MKLSKHFYRHEFACKCGCGFDTVDAELIDVLEDVRRQWGVAVKITSAARCLEHNSSIGSTDKSQHVLGRAADIVVQNVAPIHVHNYLDSIYPNTFGLGSYDNFTHIDTRSIKARWG